MINIKNLSFSYPSDSNFSLSISNLTIKKGESLLIEGPSGCGKTTLLNLITGMIIPKYNQITINNIDIASLSPIKQDLFRADHFGIIHQSLHLIPFLNVLENIIIPCTFSKIKTKNIKTNKQTIQERAIQIAIDLGLHKELFKKPINTLSIGQQQRVAMARALIGDPSIIIADEPTSALDQKRAESVIKLLINQCQKKEITLLLVSHDNHLKNHFNRSYSLIKNTEKSHVAA